ncbi:MAG: helix-turn-helix domain-containing protein [Anaerolineae bacterium]|nr:helix-turn-helix domain-containing protein [Anaerolineae bacterium]
MAELSYREVYEMNEAKARHHLVECYQETESIAKTARRWHTSRQVVRKWVRRYEQEGEKGVALSLAEAASDATSSQPQPGGEAFER